MQALFGRIRRPLLGLTAPAFEGFQEDGLLTQHVRALHGADSHRDVVGRAEDAEAEKTRVGGGPDRRLERPDRLGRLGADGDEDLGGTDRVRRDGGSLDDRERVALEQRAVRGGRRVRAIAVDDDVAASGRRRRRDPPLVGGRKTAAASAAKT